MQSELDPVRNQRTLGLSIKIKIEREGWRSWDLGRQVDDFWSEYLLASASVGWYDNWFWYLISPPQMSGDTFLLWVCCQIELSASLLVCTFQSDSDWTGLQSHTDTYQLYSVIIRIAILSRITRLMLFWMQVSSSQLPHLLVFRLRSGCSELRVTNNSLELTLTYEGLRVWPGQ